MTTKADRVARLLAHLEGEIAQSQSFDDVVALPGWSIMRGPHGYDASTFYVSTPTQPRPQIKHAVPPFEHCLDRVGLVALLRSRWVPEARAFLGRTDLARMRGAAVVSGSDPSPPIIVEVLAETIDVRELRWSPDPAGVWHRIGAPGVKTNGIAKDAPPVGSVVCERCMLLGVRAEHEIPTGADSRKPVK